jgi:hypothetical protein
MVLRDPLGFPRSHPSRRRCPSFPAHDTTLVG